MKTLIAIIGFLAAFNAVFCYPYSDSSSSDVSTSQYIQYLKQRSQVERLRRNFAAVCPGKDDELDAALIKLKDCADEIDETTETACSAIRNHFLRCSKPFIELFEECLPEQSKEVPRVVFEAINSGAAYLCKTDGEHIFELANTCVFKSNLRSMRCERRLKAKLQEYKNSTPTKTEICEMMQSFKPCFHSHLEDSCGNIITRESFMGIYDAILTPCKSNETTRKVEFNGENEVELLS